MPFNGPAQEMAMMINAPDVWKKWVRKYGHAPGWTAYKRRMAKKAAATRKRGRRKITRKR